MGRIKTAFVKRLSEQLLSKFRDRFTTDFQENKERVKELVDYPSKKIINQVAGYITRKMRKYQEGDVYE